MRSSRLKDALKQTPLIGPWLRKRNEWFWESYRQAQEIDRGVRARIYDALGLKHDIRLTVAQQWRVILRRSGTLLRSLPEAREPGILFMTIWGGRCSPVLSALESVLAVAVRLRGVRSMSLMCDKALPACSFDPLGNHVLPVPEPYASTGLTAVRCRECSRSVRAYYEHLPVSLLRFNQFSKPDDLERVLQVVEALSPDYYRDFVYRDVKVGEHAYASVLRWLGRGSLLDDPYHLWLFRRHLVSAMLVTDLTERALTALQPRRIMAVHGIYADHGTVCEVARKNSVPVVVYSFPYRRDTIMLCHGDTYHRAMVTEPIELWEDLQLSSEQERRLECYIDSRRRGGQDSITYHPNPIESKAALVQELGLDRNVPIISLFTNVIWDAQLYHSYNAFDNQLDWLFQTIEYFMRRPDLQLVIRIHPAETKATKKTDQPLRVEIANRFPVLPDHIKVIPPESDLSSYTLAEMSQAALIYGTKMGLEIALRGVPVIIAGESMNRGKGFTYDVESPEQYFDLLDHITELPRNTSQMMSRAEKYAYHFYFRRQIDFPFLTGYKIGAPEGLRLSFKSLGDLMPGRYANLDRICDGILSGTEFVVD